MDSLKKHEAISRILRLALIILFIGLSRTPPVDSLELKFYDMLMNLSGAPKAASDIVLVDIDDDSIEKLGRWPWPRGLIADGLSRIHAAGPKGIGLNILLGEPEGNVGLEELKRLEELFKNTVLNVAGTRTLPFQQALTEARTRLDTDTRLTEAVNKSESVVLPVLFKTFGHAGREAAANVALLLPYSIPGVWPVPGTTCPSASGIEMPLPEFLHASGGIGHINPVPDADGKVRHESLLIEYGRIHIPSYALQLAAVYLGVPVDKIRVDLGLSVTLGKLEIPITDDTRSLIHFKGPKGSFKSYSFFDLMNDRVPAGDFRNKLVLVSTTATGISTPLRTPTSSAMSLGELTAHSVWTILNRQFILHPDWDLPVEVLLIALIGLTVAFLLPRLKPLSSTIIFLALLTAIPAASAYLFLSKGYWMPAAYPTALLAFGFAGVLGVRFFAAQGAGEKVEAESMETNRMLGLSFQSQGMLDMAFDMLRRVPVDDAMKDILYNLALDYERKRQFNKAVAVYEYIEQHDAGFKDIPERKEKLIQASETIALGTGLNGDPMISGATEIRPTLGRYELVKQLGKGAMGYVYLGQDPRINRITAIKTFQFDKSLEPAEAERLKEKFFIEAESAGTLSHPNIVTIYDAGEEQDLAYIAMEYLDGEDLQGYTKEGRLLPVRKIISYIADIADALDYAHAKGIVHRDIKPANVMLLKNGTLKITDFGIARITTSSQTQTGVVKGTPFYMSPEQISGKKVDGRSDIFSLGVMQYQLLTGRTPFAGDSLAALMHQIMNVPHPDPRQFKPGIPKSLVDILGLALEKDRGKRYQRASLMAEHLRQLGRLIDDVVGRKEGKEH